MNIDLKKGAVTIYEAKCSLCGQKIRSPEKGGCQEALAKHIDNECETAKTMRNWEKQGIYKEMVGFLREEALAKDLKKQLKHYSIEEIRHSLEMLEIEVK